MLGRKAIVKQGYHKFKIGEKIEFLGMAEGFVYSENTDIYNFENKKGMSQHLEREEFEWTE